ncbi:hypothetical protein ACFQ3R_11405 [Mesonia ostreae]|uniref:Beta-lactamase-inhibitor-like PepSY-like domain-containing protein n=1 Tax=Mesonia ostreae TaxID=861110 RepID=A0ABU2KMK4_9FLAO|nr:hypothetical protein [Mesonia ostreae]MDT0295902.1 hypothetical protein [Mesonia ostreae]
MKKTEFIENPEVILSKEFDIKSTSFGGIYIGENIQELNGQEISEYYDNEDKNQNLKIKNGWILMESGIQYVIKNSFVKMIRVKENGLKKFVNFDEVQIQKLIGKPNKIKNDGIMWVWDYVVEAKVHHYKKKKLKIHYSTENGKVCELEIG